MNLDPLIIFIISLNGIIFIVARRSYLRYKSGEYKEKDKEDYFDHWLTFDFVTIKNIITKSSSHLFKRVAKFTLRQLSKITNTVSTVLITTLKNAEKKLS